MPLKQVEIRLTDIWREQELELCCLRRKTANLERCQRANEMINKSLLKCNETLLAIIDKCRIDLVDNKEIIELITIIRDDENSIAMWKNRLKSYKREINVESSEQFVNNSLPKYCHKCLEMCDCLDKCVQTDFERNAYVSVINLNELNDANNDANTSVITNDIKVEYTGVTADIFNVECRLISNEINIQTNDRTDIIATDDCNGDANNIVIDSSLQPIGVDSDNDNVCIDLPSDSESDFCIKEGEDIGIDCSDDTDWERDAKRSKKRKLKHKSTKRKSKTKPKTALKSQSTPNPKTKCFRVKSDQQYYVDSVLAEYRINKKYVCNTPNCEFVTGIKRIFMRHLNKHNKGEYAKVLRPYACDWPGCDVKFKNLRHLKNHISFKHNNYRPFECDWPGCGFKLRREYDLEIHRRIHTKEKPLACEWPGCAFTCNAKWSLITHMRKHTGEKPYECLWPDCNYRCSQPGTLILHKRKHTGEKPYTCDHNGCNKTFSVLSGLHLHKHVHKKRSTNE